jgi:transposase-like protein
MTTEIANPPLRRQFTAEVKLKIIREARLGNLPVSQVCAKYDISPTLFYQWERTAEKGARTALQAQPRGRKKLRPAEEELLAEIQRLREIVAELSSENPSASSGQVLQLKKGRWR